MDDGKLRDAIRSALAEAELAVHPQKCGLMDYCDLQRVVGRLSETLQLAQRFYDGLRLEYDDLSERLKRSPSAHVLDSQTFGHVSHD